MEVGGDVASASGSLAGLVLVYIGSLSNSFSSFQAQERRAVMRSYQRRAWFAFVGFVLLLFSIAAAILGKWMDARYAILGALILFLVGLVWVLITGILSAMDIR